MIFLFRSIPLSVSLSVPLSVTPQSELIGFFRQGPKNMDFPLSVLNSMFHLVLKMADKFVITRAVVHLLLLFCNCVSIDFYSPETLMLNYLSLNNLNNSGLAFIFWLYTFLKNQYCVILQILTFFSTIYDYF